MSEQAREFETFGLRLNQERELTLAKLDNSVDLAEKQAGVLSTALSEADINIMGNEFKFFDSTINKDEQEYYYMLRIYDSENQVWNSKVCTTRINCTVDGSFGISIYPNPTSNTAILSCPSLAIPLLIKTCTAS